MPFGSGNKLRVGDFNVVPKGLVLRANRQTAKTGVTAEAGVLRLDGIPLKAGRAYLIQTTSLRFNGTSGETAEARLRIDTTGAQATTSSTEIGSTENAYQAGFVPAQTGVIVTEFYPGASDVTASIILTLARTGGSNATAVDGSSARPISILVYDMGMDPGDTGVDL